MLVIPFLHVQDFFVPDPEEKYAIPELAGDGKRVIGKTKKTRRLPYRVGMPGAAAGQSVMHCHCQVIPWYHGDTE
jgi:diadenosine tetraphosphate (Ap4A) HIT family hydrolase